MGAALPIPTAADQAEADALLLRRLADGDEAAFAEIVRDYAGLVYGACYRVLGDRGWAEDVAQETFFRLLKSRQRVSQSLGGWLHRAATRLAVDTLRSESARRRREAVIAAEAPTAAHPPAEGSSWSEVSPLVDVALSELPPDERELLVRHFLQGVAQAQLAAERGVSTATLSRRVKDAVVLLRQRLAEKGVTLAPAVLMLLLSRNTAEAAPAALMTELGKMAMISGGPLPVAPASGGAAGGIPEWASVLRPVVRSGRAASRPKLALAACVGLGVYLALPYAWVAGPARPAPVTPEAVEHVEPVTQPVPPRPK